MALDIIMHPHPTLRYQSKPIRRVDAELRKIVDEMFDLMYESSGVGLAANQVNLPLKLFVANPSGVRGDGEEFVVINPEIQRPKGSEVAEEGCLSLPGVLGDVKRPKSIQLSAYDLKGNAVDVTVDGFLARVFQHEIDHLNGIMFFDRMADDALAEIAGRIQEFELDFRSRQSAGGLADDATLLAELTQWTDKYA
ncbi:peptide deformylase [Stieleria varia]|nr:peptide deformylase [Stieleria varia]